VLAKVERKCNVPEVLTGERDRYGKMLMGNSLAPALPPILARLDTKFFCLHGERYDAHVSVSFWASIVQRKRSLSYHSNQSGTQLLSFVETEEDIEWVPNR
jgi:hypothetical protein